MKILLLIQDVGLLLPINFNYTGNEVNQVFKALLSDIYITGYTRNRTNTICCFFCILDGNRDSKLDQINIRGKTNIPLFLSLLMRMIDSNTTKFDADKEVLGDDLFAGGNYNKNPKICWLQHDTCYHHQTPRIFEM